MQNELRIENANAVQSLILESAFETVKVPPGATVKKFWQTHGHEGSYLILTWSVIQALTPGGPLNLHFCLLKDGILRLATLDYLSKEVLAVQKIIGHDHLLN